MAGLPKMQMWQCASLAMLMVFGSLALSLVALSHHGTLSADLHHPHHPHHPHPPDRVARRQEAPAQRDGSTAAPAAAAPAAPAAASSSDNDLDDVSEKPAPARPAGTRSSPHAYCEPWPGCTLPPRHPTYYNLCDVLDAWPPTDPTNRFATDSVARDSPVPIPRFRFGVLKERAAAEAYKHAALPVSCAAQSNDAARPRPACLHCTQAGAGAWRLVGTLPQNVCARAEPTTFVAHL